MKRALVLGFVLIFFSSCSQYSKRIGVMNSDGTLVILFNSCGEPIHELHVARAEPPPQTIWRIVPELDRAPGRDGLLEFRLGDPPEGFTQTSDATDFFEETDEHSVRVSTGDEGIAQALWFRFKEIPPGEVAVDGSEDAILRADFEQRAADECLGFPLFLRTRDWWGVVALGTLALITLGVLFRPRRR